jgi:hypothetical protein
LTIISVNPVIINNCWTYWFRFFLIKQIHHISVKIYWKLLMRVSYQVCKWSFHRNFVVHLEQLRIGKVWSTGCTGGWRLIDGEELRGRTVALLNICILEGKQAESQTTVLCKTVTGLLKAVKQTANWNPFLLLYYFVNLDQLHKTKLPP